MATILRGIDDGITVQDPSGALLYANDAAARLVGCESAAELLSTPVDQVLGRFEIFDEAEQPLTQMDLPGRQALAGVEAERTIGFRVKRSAEIRWAVVRAMPVVEDGKVTQAINVFRDITERRALDEARERVRRHLQFLNDATRRLDEGPLDAESRLGGLARVAVPSLADWCAVYMLQNDLIELKAFAHRDPELEPLARELQLKFPMNPERSVGAPQVIRSGEPELVAEITDEIRQRAAINAEHLELLRKSGMRSSMAVPLKVRKQTLGAVVFASNHYHYTAEDVRVAEELAERAGIAVETARLYEAAQAAVRDREDLMAVVSHDLRNPLSTIAMATELLLRSAAPESKEKAQRAAGNVQRAVQRMERMIHDFLDLARIEGAGLPLERNEHDGANLVAESIDHHSAVAADRHIKLVNESDGPAKVTCDRDRVLQLLANLVGNALKFSPEGGAIRVGARRRTQYIEFWVADDGPGVPEGERAKIFERYWQARRDRKGIGLGLAIARGVVEAHGGRIWVEGGKGARFVFTLPAQGQDPLSISQ